MPLSRDGLLPPDQPSPMCCPLDSFCPGTRKLILTLNEVANPVSPLGQSFLRQIISRIGLFGLGRMQRIKSFAPRGFFPGRSPLSRLLLASLLSHFRAVSRIGFCSLLTFVPQVVRFDLSPLPSASAVSPDQVRSLAFVIFVKVLFLGLFPFRPPPQKQE